MPPLRAPCIPNGDDARGLAHVLGLHLDDGRIIETISDAWALVLTLPADHQQLKKWQDVAHLLTRTAETGNFNLLAVVQGQIEEALRRPPFAPVRLVELPPKKPSPDGSPRLG
jgi:hypothetical protein